MRLLADQDIWKETVDLLRGSGHDVKTARDLGLSTASDRELLIRAAQDDRILITRDSDFGNLVFLSTTISHGVILLRIAPETKDRAHAELTLVLTKHSEERLEGCFCTVEPGRHRIRLLPVT